METSEKPKRELTAGEKGLLVVGGVLGYLIGWGFRRALGWDGALPGAIFGGLGVGCGVGLADFVIRRMRGR